MTSYRRYRASYPFEARDSSELTITPGDNLLVGKNAQGVWPSQDKWMHGKNEETEQEGDFPGNFVEFVEEFTEPDPEANHQEKALPPLPPLPEKPPPISTRGGVQVLPISTSGSSVSPPPPPPHSATSPTHRPMAHSSSQGSVGHYPTDDDDEAPPPPPRGGGRRGTPASPYAQQQTVFENHQSPVEVMPSHPGPPKPRPRAKRTSEPSRAGYAVSPPDSNDQHKRSPPESSDQHKWEAVTYHIPVECMACEFIGVHVVSSVYRIHICTCLLYTSDAADE